MRVVRIADRMVWRNRHRCRRMRAGGAWIATGTLDRGDRVGWISTVILCLLWLLVRAWGLWRGLWQVMTVGIFHLLGGLVRIRRVA